jgi:hypothetical protein
MTEHLTDEDLEALTEASFRGGAKAWRAEIERILTERVADRLAAPEALADAWERQAADPSDPVYKIGLFSAAGELRAALHPDSSST